jgi:hypothetical protein
MRKIIITLSLFILTSLSFGYIHIFSYRDFVDFEIGEIINVTMLPSNDDGTHGSNDRWGPNNEFTWPDVPGDTNIYISTDIKPVIKEMDEEKVLFMTGDIENKSVIGLKDVPNPIGTYVMFSYDFYLEKSKNEKSTIVLFSNTEPGDLKRVYFIYDNGIVKGIRRTSRYTETTFFEKKIDLYNEWNRFTLKIRNKEIRLIFNNSNFYTEKFYDDFSVLPYYYVGNWIRKNELSNMNIYFKNFIVSHGK